MDEGADQAVGLVQISRVGFQVVGQLFAAQNVVLGRHGDPSHREQLPGLEIVLDRVGVDVILVPNHLDVPLGPVELLGDLLGIGVNDHRSLLVRVAWLLGGEPGRDERHRQQEDRQQEGAFVHPGKTVTHSGAANQ